MVGARGFEPLTPSASRKCSPPELSAHLAAEAAKDIVAGDPTRASPESSPIALATSARPSCTCSDSLGRLPFARADVAQLVEHNLAKVGVAGSNPVVRSIASPKVGHAFRVRTHALRPLFFRRAARAADARRRGQVARQGPAKPLSPVRIRASPPAFYLRKRSHCTAMTGSETASYVRSVCIVRSSRSENRSAKAPAASSSWPGIT